MSWDEYYLEICDRVGSNSKCLSRHIGAVLVRDNVIISTGYNGPPRGIDHCEPPVCPRRAMGYGSGEGLQHCPAAHAELNCILSAARLGIEVKGSTLYLNTVFPCLECTKAIINAGIKEVVATKFANYDALSLALRLQSEVIFRAYEK